MKGGDCIEGGDCMEGGEDREYRVAVVEEEES